MSLYLWSVKPKKQMGRWATEEANVVLDAVIAELPGSTREELEPLAERLIAAMFDSLPREVMGRALDPIGWPDHRAQILLELDAAISAARAEVLGSAKGDASQPKGAE